jgi:uncharacterized protein (TIGR03435 family)
MGLGRWRPASRWVASGSARSPTATFNFVLEFAPDERTRGPMGGRGRGLASTSNEPRAPDIFTALREQLGIRLEEVQAPQEYVVIDRIERPSPN